MKVIFYHLHPGVSRKLVKEYIENSEFIDGTHRVCIKNSHKLQCRCIQLDITDKRVFWAYRGSRKYPSPLISQKDAEEIGIEMTDEITVVFTKKNDVFRILTCYEGPGAPKEPSTATKEEYQECVEFWSQHALIPDEKYTLVQSLNEVPQWALEYAMEKLLSTNSQL